MLIVSCYVANAETVITADQVVRGGKVGELKQMVDKAVAASPCVKRVFVVSRTGADVPMGRLDIPLEKVASLPPCVQKKALLLIQCFLQTTPLQEYRIVFRDGPLKNGERANLALYFCKAACRHSTLIVIPRLKIVTNVVANELTI